VYTLVLLRHGQSDWNAKNLFTGWADVDLTELGEDEAVRGGELLAEAGVLPDVCHTSVQIRAIRTADIALDVMGRRWVPVRRHWRLNERHYGALQGLDKKAVAREHGPDQLRAWRRGYDTPPPKVDRSSGHHPANDPRYRELPPHVLPASECLKDVVARMLPHYEDRIVPDLRAGHVVLVAAHGNSLRALVKHLDGISDDDIAELNIPTGQPLVYTLGPDLEVIESRYLDPEAAARAAAAVAAQASTGSDPAAPTGPPAGD
jgi:2,3-bisphosphoglycerate-dependent phosphoglycerate mutase